MGGSTSGGRAISDEIRSWGLGNHSLLNNSGPCRVSWRNQESGAGRGGKQGQREQDCPTSCICVCLSVSPTSVCSVQCQTLRGCCWGCFHKPPWCFLQGIKDRVGVENEIATSLLSSLCSSLSEDPELGSGMRALGDSRSPRPWPPLPPTTTAGHQSWDPQLESVLNCWIPWWWDGDYSTHPKSHHSPRKDECHTRPPLLRAGQVGLVLDYLPG